MSSSTRPSRRALGVRLAVLAIAAGCFTATHLALERIAAYAERHFGAFLWRQQDSLQLFSAHNYVGLGRGRLLIYGPSEAREALLHEEIRPRVPGLRPLQHSLSMGTFDEGLLILEYLERYYGETAIPDAILLGITPRFVANLRHVASPLFTAINRYSPHATVDESTKPPRLVERPLLDGIRARAALLALQPDRYRRGVFAVTSHVVTRFVPTLAADRRVWGPVSQAKHLTTRITSEDRIKRWLTTPGNELELTHSWDPELDQTTMARQFQALRDFTTRHRVEVYVVNLPETSWSRDLYDPRKYAAYMRIVREELASVPFLDLRTAVPDEQFYDWSHVMWPAGRHVSKLAASLIEEHRSGHEEASPR